MDKFLWGPMFSVLLVSHWAFDLHFSNDNEYFFMCLLATRISPLEKCLLKFFVRFKNWVICPFIVKL